MRGMMSMMSMMMMMFWWVDGGGNNIGRGFPVANFYSITLSLLFIPLPQSYRSFPGPQTSLADILSLSILKSDKANYFMNEQITKRLRCKYLAL